MSTTLTPELLTRAKDLGTLTEHLEHLHELFAWRHGEKAEGRAAPLSVSVAGHGTLFQGDFADHILDSVIAYVEGEIGVRL